ncbi:hypothetical protein INT47_007247 [Mucor saturninus]|uniref:Transposase domain-containing protein n=1 Tax=Mucor saturninus TaxID=64648 RepID=A0A8H7QD91_9FUNG|nr:hypothetical protein INT47_007247 [Mucor saturninus]
MSSITQLRNEACYCTKCNGNAQGYSLVTKRTSQRHNKRARIDELERIVMERQREMVEIDIERKEYLFEEQQIVTSYCILYVAITTHQSGSMERQNDFSHSPVVESELMLDGDDSAANEVNGNDSNNEEESNAKDSDGDDVEEIEVEDLSSEGEYPFSSPEMPENPVHRSIAIFVVLFASRYVVNKGAVVLIEFINELLKIYEQDFQLPSSLPGLQKMTGFSALTKGIKKSVVCQDCHKVYEEAGSVPEFCNSSKVGSRSSCGCKLMKASSSGTLVPRRQFHYQSVKQALSVLFLRPDFEANIRHWNKELKVMDTMCDVYDGAMWKDLKDKDGVSFVADPRSLMLTLNIDWFQPFDGVTYSCGAIYLAINNLPRAERFKPENIILVGLMPGPKEPKSDEINSYLEPLVNDLNQLYVGVSIPTFECPSSVVVRAALMMVACDIPAARKTSGFTAHNSTRACYKCSRSFSRLEGTSHVDFRGFEFVKWRLANGEENRVHAEEWKSASTPSERHQLEVENGVRWSQLHRLGYFDLVRGTIIDPMHNLFLGTAKRMVETWTASGLITDRDLCQMQKVAETMVLPVGYTMLKTKIGKGFPRMKADEWKSWVLIYSPVLLRPVLSGTKFKNWISFVDACRLLTKPTITFDELDEAHSHLEKFGRECEQQYPSTILTCNMHLHLHLRDTVRDFGPVYGYWLFGFERYNGLLKNVDTNRRDGFESTYIKSFTENMYKGDLVQRLTCQSQVPFKVLLKKLTSLSNTFIVAPAPAPAPQRRFRLDAFLQASLDVSLTIKGNEALPPSALPLPTATATTQMGDIDYPHLLEYYKRAYDNEHLVDYLHASSSPFFVNDRITKIKAIDLLGQTYKGKGGSGSRGSYIQALFLDFEGRKTNAYTGEIQYLFAHNFVPPPSPSNSRPHFHHKQHVFAFVHWLVPDPDNLRPVEQVDVCLPGFAPNTFDSILPVHRILLEVATAELKIENNARMLVIPLPKKIYA